MDAVLLADFAQLPKRGLIVDYALVMGQWAFMSPKTNGQIVGVGYNTWQIWHSVQSN